MPIRKNLDSLIASYQKSDNFGTGEKQSFNEIEGLFKPTYNKEGKFKITLRFLPPVEAEDVAFVEESRDHWLKQTNGKAYSVPCRKQFKDAEGKSLRCPICEYNQKMYEKYKNVDKGYSSHKLATARPQYICNILIVENENAPETQGQVFRFKYGKAIKDLIDKCVNTTDAFDNDTGEPIPPINPYSYYGPTDPEVISGEARPGANFIWEAEPGSNGPDYSSSSFTKPIRICRGEPAVNAQGIPFNKKVGLTAEEISVIESKLYTLAGLPRKVEKLPTYQQIVERVQSKCGIDLASELDDMEISSAAPAKSAPASKVQTEDDEMFTGTVLESKPATPAPAKTVEADDAGMFSAPLTEPVKTTAPVQTSAPLGSNGPFEEAEDQDDFFTRLANGQ